MRGSGRTAVSTSRSRAPQGAAGGAKRAAVPMTDAKDDFIVNLKGQIYLLSIENEMMRKSLTGGAESGAGGGDSPRYSPVAESVRLSATRTVGSAELLSSTVPAAQYPTEIGDAFELMRVKYTQLEHKYQHDLDEARRGAEALAAQCAAQSSLIATLKKEVASGARVLADQKVLVQRVETSAGADVERAQRDVQHLHARIVELQGEKAGLGEHIAAQNDVIADGLAAAAAAAADARASEAGRVRSLDTYARYCIAARYVLRRWRHERADKLSAQAGFDRMRAEKSAAERRALKAEAAEARISATASAAAAAHAVALEGAHDALLEQTACFEALESAHAQALSDARLRAGEMAVLDEQVPSLAKRAEGATAAAARTEAQRDAALRRGVELERLLTAKASEAEALRGAAVAAEGRQGAALSALRVVEDELATANARGASLAHAEAEAARSVVTLTAELEDVGQARASVAAEVVTLRDELQRRPPIDVIKELDIANLLQRNMQAAAAMHQLLAWKAGAQV